MADSSLPLQFQDSTSQLDLDSLDVQAFVLDLLEKTVTGNYTINASADALNTLVNQALAKQTASDLSTTSTVISASQYVPFGNSPHGHDYYYYHGGNGTCICNNTHECQNPANILDHEDWDVVLTTYCVVAAVGLVCETLLHTLKHKLHHKEKAMALLNAILNELTIMGVIGFVTYIINTDCLVELDDKFSEVFEVIHMLIFIIVVVYILLTLVLTGLLYMSLATYRNFEKMPAMDVSSLLTEVTTVDEHLTPIVSPTPSKHHWKRRATSCFCRYCTLLLFHDYLETCFLALSRFS